MALRQWNEVKDLVKQSIMLGMVVFLSEGGRRVGVVEGSQQRGNVMQLICAFGYVVSPK